MSHWDKAAGSRGSIYNSEGLNVQALIDLKKEGRSVADYEGGKRGDRAAVIDMECDIWIPAARPDVIHEDNVERLKTKLIISGANIPITEGAEKILHERGVLCVPDFIANAGGVICAAVEYHEGNETTAFQTIEEKIHTNTSEVLKRMSMEKILPRQAAEEFATDRLKNAMTYRRWNIF